MPLIDLPAFAPDLIADFARLGTERVDTPVIQPAAPFLDMAGEDLRRRIFMTESETGESLCLRPEFTIPVCFRHIETATDTPKRYAYLGEVFRQRREGANEFYQAGIEDLGDADVAAADARAVHDAVLVIANRLPGRPLAVTLGDQSVFEAVVAACGLPAGWQRRLIHAFGNQAQLQRLLSELANPRDAGVFGPELDRLAITGLLDDADKLATHIDETMQATGYSTNASRSPAEIAAGSGPPRPRGDRLPRAVRGVLGISLPDPRLEIGRPFAVEAGVDDHHEAEMLLLDAMGVIRAP